MPDISINPEPLSIQELTKAAQDESLQQQKGVDLFLEKATSLVVATPADFQRAGTWLVKARQEKKKLEKERNDTVKPAHALHKLLVAKYKPGLIKIDEGASILSGKMAVYTKDEEKKSQVEAARISREDREAYEKETEDKAAAAKRATEAGDLEAAADVLDTMPSLPVPVRAAPVATPKVQGLTTRRKWVARIVNADIVPHEYRSCVPDMTVLNAIAKSSAGAKKIKGVVFEEDIGHSGRATN